MASMTETGRMIVETAERVLAAHCAPEALRAAEGGWMPDLWREVSEAGLTLALEAEGKGQFGIAAAEALDLVQACGRFAAPVPLVEAMLGNWLLQSAGGPLADGVSTLAGLGKGDTLALCREGGDWRLTGTARAVPWGRVAEQFVVVVANGDAVQVALVDAAGCGVTAGENLAREPRDTVTFDCVVAGGSVHVLDRPLRLVRAQAAGLRVIQIAGASQRIVGLTVGYAQDRVQFGRPIGKFQAVQSNIAVMGGEIAAARAAGALVAQSFADPGALCALAAAKARAGEAAGIAARYSHQVHGAIGFTQEYELHFFTKRLWSWRDEFGNEAEWQAVVGEEVIRRGGEAMWSFITDGLLDGAAAPA